MIFHVADQGIGIPPEHLPKLFTKYFRVEETRTQHVGGTGLGLALVREIAEAHGGRVWAESRPGEGSSFFFALHLVDTPAPLLPERPEKSRETLVYSSEADVVLVEDDVGFARDLIERMNSHGVSIATVTSVQATLDAVRAHPPRLIVVDLHLKNGTDGWDVLASLKSDPELAQIPVALVCASDAINARGIALAGADLILKPPRRARILDSVRRALPTAEHALVMIIESDPDVRRVLRNHLAELESVSTVEASNTAEAQVLMLRRPPQLVIMDVLTQEPEGGGFLRSVCPSAGSGNPPLILMSGASLTATEKTALQRRLARLVDGGAADTESIAQTILSLLDVRSDLRETASV